jgi:hypothetical protein
MLQIIMIIMKQEQIIMNLIKKLGYVLTFAELKKHMVKVNILGNLNDFFFLFFKYKSSKNHFYNKYLLINYLL